MPTTRFTFFARTASVVLSAMVFSVALTAQTRPAPMKVNQIEPANWHIGEEHQIVLRLSGEHLASAVGVKVRHKGIRVTNVQHPDDDHLLVTLRISPKAEPGTLMLQVFTRFMTTFAGLPMRDGDDPSAVHAELAATK
jgi:hypothetical protein